MVHRPWVGHSGLRTGDELTPGERAADRLRNGMGSWTFPPVVLLERSQEDS
jgi:hypothetical protein